MPAEAKLDMDAVANLAVNHHLNQNQIAKVFSVSREAIRQRMSTVYGMERLQAYKDNRADALAELQADVLCSITDADIKKARLAERMMVLGIAYDKERLERGYSTSIVDVRTLVVSGKEMLEELKKQRQAMVDPPTGVE